MSKMLNDMQKIWGELRMNPAANIDELEQTFDDCCQAVISYAQNAQFGDEFTLVCASVIQ